LLNHAACGSKDEATVIVDVLLEEIQQRGHHLGSRECLEILISCLLENLSLSSEQEASALAIQINEVTGGTQDKNLDVSSSEDESDSGMMDDGDDEEHAPLFDGECELCDRYIQLTKHHLIPKSTWPRMEAKLMHAADAIEGGNLDKASIILGPGLIHLMDDLSSSDKQYIRQILHRTCDICRPCHSALHRTHDNTELALWYSTIDRILEDEQMASFCKWANKQRSGKYAVHPKKNH